MLLAVLLHLLIFHLLTASDAPPRVGKSTDIKPKNSKDLGYRLTHIDTCPDVGFFFQREGTANTLTPDTCFLCFCQQDHTAVCWKRDNRRCNTESFHYHGSGKRGKRSPGFTDIFFRDASRDFFNKNTKPQCKPYESSFSDDCPPADWCTGCTVCDCDANGHWDCHLLSFCPDDKKKSRKQNENVPGSWKPLMDKKKEKLINTSSKTAPEARPNSIKNDKSTKKADTKPKSKPKPEIKRGGKQNKKKVPPKRIVQKRVPPKPGMKPKPGKMKPPIKYRKVDPKKKDSTKEMIIKKDIAARNPIQIKKSNKVDLELELAHKLMKRVMQSLKKTVEASVKNMSDGMAKQNAYNIRNMKAKTKVRQSKKNLKNVNKRQIKKPNMKPPCNKKTVPMTKPVYRAKGKPPKKISTKRYIRHKRDVTMPENIGIPASVTHGSLAESPKTTEPLTITPATRNPPVTSKSVTSLPEISIPGTSNVIVPDDSDFLNAVMGSSKLPENEYYKYTVGMEESRTKLNTSVKDTVTKLFNLTETTINLLGAEVHSVVTEKRQDKEVVKVNDSKVMNPKENGLKYSKWMNLKILNEKGINPETDIKDIRLMKLLPYTNKINRLGDKNSTHGNKFERKLSYRKINTVKLLNYPKCRFNNCKVNNKINIHKPNKIYPDVQGLKPKLKIEPKKITNHNKNSPTQRKRKPGILKYLKRIFNKIFKGRRISDKMSKHQLIKTLCDNFGPCMKVNKKDRVLLNSKISDLDKETSKILRTVKIIKGLLKLLVLPENINSNFSKQEHLRNDIHKLNHILKGVYSENGQVKFTATQVTQIEYIKRSTQDFIQSVSKFASLLNQIITILTKQNANRYSNKAKHLVNKDLLKDDPFQSFKNLLLRYNLVQNTFMKQMYEQLHNFEYKTNVKPKVSESKDLNNSITIENISRNIIHNLRKLKYLAQTGSYSGRERVRTKRNTGRDDDAIEYLLLLLEYLIKQNHPLDTEPVNDGIDLLIEAIQNAPDIKPIRKKVLEYTPALNLDTTTSTTSFNISNSSSEDTKSEDDSPSESDKTSSSDDSSKSKQKENVSELKENNDFVETVADDEKEFEEKLQFDRRAETDKMDEITELAFFSNLGGAEPNMLLEPDNLFETTTVRNTIKPLELETSDKLYSRGHLNLGETLAGESYNLDKSIDYSEGGGKKIEVYTGDMEEETVIQSTVTKEPDITTTMSTEFLTEAVQDENSKEKIKYENYEKLDNDSVDKKSKLKWIEENFGKETENEFTDFEENNSTIVTTPVTVEAITSKTLDKNEVTGLTRAKSEVSEVVEREKNEIEKKTAAKLSAEEVMFRKQMELLNSLDYGTERADVFESDSKDSNVEERYTGDSFPSYFV